MNYDVQRISEVCEETLQRCFELMSANYLAMAEDLFYRAFAEKDLVILFQNEEQKICGFTLLGFNMCGTGTERYNVLYSGDTIMDVEHWGSSVVHRAFLHTAGAFAANDPNKRLYWLLLSSGHRTYMYLPLFWKEYYPAAEPDRHASALFTILDTCSRKMFGENWDEAAGLVRFNSGNYTVNVLRPELNEATFKLAHKLHVRFFLDKNPGFSQGDELACLVELSSDNLRKRWLPLFHARREDKALLELLRTCHTT